MAYFELFPNIELEKKPFIFPYSEIEYDLVKNFFKRSKLTVSSYNYTTFFTEYVITDDDRPDYISYKTYGTSEYDWIVLLTNNVINPIFDWPVRDYKLYDLVNNAYFDAPGNIATAPADRLHHYETIEKKNSLGKIVLKEGLVVGSNFYNTNYKYNDDGYILEVPGNQVSFPVTNYEYELKLNTERRKIYLLRPEFIEDFKLQFRNNMKYFRSSSYIDSSLKKAGI
jgi:hypothetical protein